MYVINRKVEKPDIQGMYECVKKLMQRGVRIAECTELLNEYDEFTKQLDNDFSEKYGVQNIRSTQQLVKYIQSLSNSMALGSRNDILEICYDQYTGKWTTDAQAMEQLADLGYTFAQDLLDYRHAKKFRDSIKELVDLSDSDRLVHPEVSLLKTNRISYSKPGLMNIPKKLLWKLIEPYHKGNILYSIDIKNQEPSILINVTGAESLKGAIMNPDGLYSTMFKLCFKPLAVANILIDTLSENRVYTAGELRAFGTVSPLTYAPVKPDIQNYKVNGKKIISIETKCIGSKKGIKPSLPDKVKVQLEDKSYEELSVTWDTDEVEKRYKKDKDYSVIGTLEGVEVDMSKAERNEFKRAWLAISYGAGKQLVKKNCRLINGERVYHYITSIDAIKDYRKRVMDLASKGICKINTVFGTPLDAGTTDKQKLKRVMLNVPIQGSGADILSILIRHFTKYTEAENLTDKLMLYYTRHDELIIEVDRSFYNSAGVNRVEWILSDIFEHRIDDWVPFKIEVKQVGSLREKLGLILSDDEDEVV